MSGIPCTCECGTYTWGLVATMFHLRRAPPRRAESGSGEMCTSARKDVEPVFELAVNDRVAVALEERRDYER